MGYTVEGTPMIGFRVVSDSGPLSGRMKTPEDALAAAGIRPESKRPRKAAPKAGDK